MGFFFLVPGLTALHRRCRCRFQKVRFKSQVIATPSGSVIFLTFPFKPRAHARSSRSFFESSIPSNYKLLPGPSNHVAHACLCLGHSSAGKSHKSSLCGSFTHSEYTTHFPSRTMPQRRLDSTYNCHENYTTPCTESERKACEVSTRANTRTHQTGL